MPTLSLSLLGPFQAWLDGQPLAKFRTSKVQALLIYLAVEAGIAHRREALMELLWPGLPLKSAQVNLRQTLYQLRRTLPELSATTGDQPVPLLQSDRQSVQLNPVADVRLDVAHFSQLLGHNPTPNQLTQAVALYRGDFLCDFYLPDSSEFEDWATTKRAELQRQALDALEALTAHHIERGEYEQAQHYAWRTLEIDDLRENAHWGLMMALALQGQRTAALAQYQIFRRRLQRELGVEPSAKTTALYQQIQADALHESQERRLVPARTRAGMPVFLFTDIEGSTPLWETHREAMLPALLAHNRILEEQIALHGGRILELRGDGVKAVFEGVDPLPCALAIQKKFSEQDWGAVGTVRIRVGLHSAPPEAEGHAYFLKGDQYYGPALHQAARVMDTGHGGQILVSAQVRDAFPLPRGAMWQDFGFQQLKGIEEPLHIFGLLHPDLPQREFPPLRIASAQAKTSEKWDVVESAKYTGPPHNLPPQQTPFVGREAELADLDRLIADPQIRLITILGPGGMGKTRLALAAAQRQLDATLTEDAYAEPLFPHGVFFVSLAALSLVDQIVPTVAEALNFRLVSDERESRGPEQQVLDYLREKRLLLILDNFENLLLPSVLPSGGEAQKGGADLVAAILGTAPGVQILVTSRERLLLHEDQAYPIRGLQFPDWERPEDTAGYTAAQLFLQSARRVQPDFELSGDDLTYLARICRLLEGMPLGLELAAGWVDVLSLSAVSAEIQRGIDFLETEWRDVPARHRSMRAVFDASWHRLSDGEQDVFTQLCVFRGGFTRAAAKTIAGADLLTLSRLVDRSLLQYNRVQDRYEMHELLRQYGADKLAQDSGHENAVLDRHSAFYCGALKQWEVDLKGSRASGAAAQIGIDVENVRAAWEWAANHCQTNRLEQALEGLCLFYVWSGRYVEGEAACKQAANGLGEVQRTAGISESAATSDEAQLVWTKVQLRRSLFNLQMGNLRSVRTLLRECQAQLDCIVSAGYDIRSEQAYLHWVSAGITEAVLHGTTEADWKKSRWHLEQSAALYRALEDQWMMANVLLQLSIVNYTWGKHTHVRATLEECLRVFRALGYYSGAVGGYYSGAVGALNMSGSLARAAGDYDSAQRKFEESLALARVQADLSGTASSLVHLGWLALFLGDFEAAANRLRESAAIYREIGVRAYLVMTLTQLSAAHWFSGEFKGAYTVIEEARAIAEDVQSRVGLQTCALYHAWLDVAAGQFAGVRTVLSRLLTVSSPDTLVGFFAALAPGLSGWVALAEGDYAEARLAALKAVAAIRDMQIIESQEYTAWSLALLGRAEYGLGSGVAARGHLLEALEIVVAIRAFIPLLHLMPLIPAVLADEEDKTLKERAVELYAMAESHPFVANSRLFKDIAGRYVTAATVEALPPQVLKAAQTRGRALDWWETADGLLSELQALGWAT